MSSAPVRSWTADVELTMEAAARLIASQFDDLPSPRLEPLGHGWDNDAYLVNGELVFRFPRRKLAEVCMRNEIASLPRIAEALPIPVPRITHVGRAGLGYPYPFAGYPLIRGRTACSLAWTEEERAGCAEPLGRFLSALHRLPVPKDAPPDPAGDKTVEMLVGKILAAGRVEEVPRKRSLELLRTPEWNGEAHWVHGDLYARHLLVDDRKKLCGVIDWGDVHAGDPADDLSIAFAFLPADARREFFEAYGEVDESTADRARLYALHSGAVVSAYAQEVGDPILVEMGRATLKFATE